MGLESWGTETAPACMARMHRDYPRMARMRRGVPAWCACTETAHPPPWRACASSPSCSTVFTHRRLTVCAVSVPRPGRLLQPMHSWTDEFLQSGCPQAISSNMIPKWPNFWYAGPPPLPAPTALPASLDGGSIPAANGPPFNTSPSECPQCLTPPGMTSLTFHHQQHVRERP